MTVGARHDPDGWRWKIDASMRFGGFGPWRPEWTVTRLPGLGMPFLGVLASELEEMGWGTLPHHLAKYIPEGGRLELLEGAGHFVHIEQPDVVAAMVLDFLGVDMTITMLRHNKIDLALHTLREGKGREGKGREGKGRDGDGTPLLLLHGLGEASPVQAPHWASDWRGPVVALDFTGHGHSTVPPGGGYTAEIVLADADVALAELGTATLVGRGLGAYVALMLAGARPQQIRGAVLCDGPGLGGGAIGPTSQSFVTLAPSPHPPDPYALFELSRDLRPPDYATLFVRMAVESSGLEEPIAVAAIVRPPWLAAVVEEVGVTTSSIADALAMYAQSTACYTHLEQCTLMVNSWVRPGRGVAVGVAEAIVELQGDDRLREVIIVVPPGATAGTLRRLLPRVSGGVAGIRFLTPIDLAVELVDSSVSTMRGVTTQLQLAAISSVLSSDDCPQVLHGVRDHPATIDALVDMAMALRAAHVLPGALQSLAGDPVSVRAALVEVIVQARQRLVSLGVRDESATLAAIGNVDDADLASLRVVLVVTDTFHPAQVPFLTRLAGQPLCRVVSVVPTPTDTALAGQLMAFDCTDSPDADAAEVPRLISCPDPDEEVRHTVRLCAELIDAAVPADDIAIVCASQAYRRPVRDELQRAGIAWSGGAVERLSGSIAGQALRHIVDGIVGQWDRPSVFRLLSVAPLYPLGDFGLPRRVGQWTTLCRRLSLVTEADWDRADDALTAANEARRQRFAVDESKSGPTARETADREALDRLQTLVERLRSQSKRVGRAKTWEAAAKELNSMLADHIGVPTWRERAWAEGPAWQRNAADHVERVVAGLAELDHQGIAVPFGAATMRQVVGTLLDTPVRRRGDASGAVSIADIGGAVCIDASRVFVVGLNEGVLPATTTDDLLLGRDLPDIAAKVIEGPRALVSRAERAWNALLHSDATVTGTFARTDLRRGGEVYPSPLLVGMPIEHHQSHAEGLLDGAALTTSEQLARRSDSHLASLRLGRRANALRARLDPEPTEFDGIVGPHPALAPDGKQWAITSLERQAACGLGYFGQFVLGVSDETDAATILSIEPAERGVLVHAVFEQVAAEWLALEPDQRPPWLRGDHLQLMHQRAIDVLDELAASIGIQHRLGHASAWGAERVHILRSIAATLEAEAREATVPVASEHSFTDVPVVGAMFRGKIDRIDLMPDGGLRVTDFKTGVVGSVRNALADGRSLQLPLYARAADQDRASMTTPAPAGAPAATARYLQVRDAKATPRDVPLDAALIAEFEGYVRRWLDEVADGHFVPRPHPSNGRCLMCCVDSLGIEELAERARLFAAGDQPEESEVDW